MVASDHSPCPPAARRTGDGDFLAAWGGIASLELRLPLVWTAARARGHGLVELAEWLCAAPARLLGLTGRKGVVAAGADADLVVWDLEATFTVTEAGLHQRHPLTPYTGRVLHGVVRTTFLGGRRIWDQGGFPGRPRGRLLAGAAR